MASKYVSHGGFTEACKTFHQFKGVVQPKCGCGSCWETYFRRNPTKVAAAVLALKTFGPDTLIKAQGADHAYEVEARENYLIAAGLQKHRSNYAGVALRRGTKYLRNLRRWISLNPNIWAEAVAE